MLTAITLYVWLFRDFKEFDYFLYEFIRHCHSHIYYRLAIYRQQVKSIADGLASIRNSDNAYKAIIKIRDLGYKSAADDRTFILSTLADKDDSIQGFLSKLEELEHAMQNASYNRSVPYILTTIHLSKGLEYDNVIIMDEISPVFPDNRSDIEEERRLFYVAMTRAKNNIILLSYENGKQPFIDKIEKLCTPKRSDHQKQKSPSSAKRTPSLVGHPASASQFIACAKVSHQKFGIGEITLLQDDTVTIRFDRYGEK